MRWNYEWITESFMRPGHGGMIAEMFTNLDRGSFLRGVRRSDPLLPSGKPPGPWVSLMKQQQQEELKPKMVPYVPKPKPEPEPPKDGDATTTTWFASKNGPFRTPEMDRVIQKAVRVLYDFPVVVQFERQAGKISLAPAG